MQNLPGSCRGTRPSENDRVIGTCRWGNGGAGRGHCLLLGTPGELGTDCLLLGAPGELGTEADCPSHCTVCSPWQSLLHVTQAKNLYNFRFYLFVFHVAPAGTLVPGVGSVLV